LRTLKKDPFPQTVGLVKHRPNRKDKGEHPQWTQLALLSTRTLCALKFALTVKLAFAAVGSAHWSSRVSDTGIGIAAADANRVFDEFERASHDDIQGAGIGLAIVKELCRVLDGKIGFTSREGALERRSRSVFCERLQARHKLLPIFL
jgi:nitrogen-specific signal transduction histidine kinase